LNPIGEASPSESNDPEANDNDWLGHSAATIDEANVNETQFDCTNVPRDVRIIAAALVAQLRKTLGDDANLIRHILLAALAPYP